MTLDSRGRKRAVAMTPEAMREPPPGQPPGQPPGPARERTPGPTPGPAPKPPPGPTGKPPPGPVREPPPGPPPGAAREPLPEPVREPEPRPTPGFAAIGADRLFVIQEHHARGMHWNLRLERDGVFVSWAVPKGMPDDPARNHLAVRTADLPLAGIGFAGGIPRGEYGPGAVGIWDSGSYEPLKWEADEVKVVLHGRRVSGGYALFRTGGENWMIHRERVTLPQWVRPMLTSAGNALPLDEGGWAYEMKWDGVRASAYLAGRRLLRLMSRTGRDITVTYPELQGLGAAAGSHELALDGEIVAFDDGRPSFEALQPRIHIASAAQAARLASLAPVAYLVFDLLHLDGRPTLALPYAKRRELLESLGLAGRCWQTPPAFTGLTGTEMLRVAADQGLEGIVAKRLDSPYREGIRSAEWRKVKRLHRQEVVVGGVNPGKGARAGQVGSLLVGVQTDGGLAYAGRVGTGFTDQTLRLLGERLAPLRRTSSPFTTSVPPEHARGVRWVQPSLVIEVEFTCWTSEGRMRAPSYRGMRVDKDPGEVRRET